jgi:hypothetical protein
MPGVTERGITVPERKSLKTVPKFKAEDEERDFWTTHDSTRYVDWNRAKPATFSHLKASAAKKIALAERVEQELRTPG